MLISYLFPRSCAADGKGAENKNRQVSGKGCVADIGKDKLVKV